VATFIPRRRHGATWQGAGPPAACEAWRAGSWSWPSQPAASKPA